MGFPKARPDSTATMDGGNASLESSIDIPDGVGSNGHMVWHDPWIVEKAPAVGEAQAAIVQYTGEWPYTPQEVPTPVGGPRLEATGAHIMTDQVEWPIFANLTGGQKFDIFIEALDVITGDSFAGETAFFENTPKTLPQVHSLFTRDTAAVSAGTNALSNLTLAGANIVVTLVGFNLPTGTPTADIEVAGRFIIKNDSMRPVNQVEFNAVPWEAIEATSWPLTSHSIAKKNVNLSFSQGVPSPIVAADMDISAAVTTQTNVAIWGARYTKRIEPPNPLKNA